MIELYAATVQRLPTRDVLFSLLDPAWRLAWEARHPIVKNETVARQSLAGLCLLSAAGARGELTYAENGRPFLVGEALDFNISHTEGLVVCAVERDEVSPRVGIDAEALEHVKALPYAALAARWCSKREQALFASNPTAECFLRLWTRKEALIKYSGEGLCGLRNADTVVAEEGDIRFAEYWCEDHLVTLCHSARRVVPQEIAVIKL